MAGATRYDDLARAITESYPSLPKRLQGLARYALDNPDAMALATVAEIARDAAVPPSAVIRFANAMGFDGYLPLQRVYRERLVARSATYRERIEALRASGGGADDAIRPLIDSAVGDLDRLREHLDARALRPPPRWSSTRARSTCSRSGARSRSPPTSSTRLSQLELRAHLLDNAGGMLRRRPRWSAARIS